MSACTKNNSNAVLSHGPQSGNSQYMVQEEIQYTGKSERKSMQNKHLNPLDNMQFMALLLIPFFEPSTISQILPTLDRFINLWKALSIMIIIMMFLWRKQISFMLMAVLAYFLVMIFCTLFNSGNYMNVFRNCIPYVAFSMLTEMGIRKNCKVYFTVVFKIYFILILINLILLFFYPNGIWVDEYYSVNTYNFLGIDNEVAINTSAPLIAIAVLCSAFRRKRLTASALLMLVMISAMTLIRWSATGVVSWFVELGLILYVLYVRKKALPERLNIYTFYLIYIGLEILIVFVRAQGYLSFVIENILHKNIDFGRTVIWDQYLALIVQAPIIGHGVFEGHGLARIGKYMYGTHNVVIGLLTKGGIIGLLAYFIPFFIAATKLYRMRKHYLSSVLTIAIFSFLLVFIMEAQYEAIWVFGFLFIADNIESIIKQCEVYSVR